MSFFFYFDEHLFIPFFLFLWWAFKSQLFSLPYFNEKTIANGESLSSSHQISISLAYFSPFQASSFLLNGGGRKKRFSRSVINFEREGGGRMRDQRSIYIVYIYIYSLWHVFPPLRNRWLRIQHSSVNDIELTLSSDFFFFQLETRSGSGKKYIYQGEWSNIEWRPCSDDLFFFLSFFRRFLPTFLVLLCILV